MLRAVSSIYIETQALELFTTARRDVFKLFRTASTTSAASQTVLTSSSSQAEGGRRAGGSPPPPPPPPPPRRPPNARQGWTVAATALALTASIGGVYFYHKLNDDEKERPAQDKEAAPPAEAAPAPESYPARAAQLPAHVQYLLVGGGTASFAAMRAIRSARPDAQVLIVGEELALPYMRPPLSKELWREPELARAASALDSLSFRQWNGKRRSVVYEPPAFYAPVEALAAGAGGAAAARGWRVERLDVLKHEAHMVSLSGERAVVRYSKALVAPGLVARRAGALAAARAGGRVLALRGAADAARLAALLDRPDVTRVAVVGGGFLASELSAALADRLRGTGATVTQVFREAAPLAGVLPGYLAAEAARRLRLAGVALRPGEVVGSEADAAGAPVRLALADGDALDADLVVECVGGAVDPALAEASGLELDAARGGLLVTAELQARADVWAAGDAACFYDAALGRRRVEHHDHAVVSGRLAGENMAAVRPARPYDHQSMFWSDLGPDLGYEAIGIIDSRLPTVGVFSADAVTDEETERVAVVSAGGSEAADEAAARGTDAAARRYERGVVFYLRERRVVGVLLWNLFNRMHVARQVLKQGEFEDLFEVAKLFALQEEE